MTERTLPRRLQRVDYGARLVAALNLFESGTLDPDAMADTYEILWFLAGETIGVTPDDSNPCAYIAFSHAFDRCIRGTFRGQSASEAIKWVKVILKNRLIDCHRVSKRLVHEE